LKYLIPSSLGDYGYDAFARRRYRWFGKKEQCHVLNGVKERFVEWNSPLIHDSDDGGMKNV
jgi:predicted DCC family thiol-disulfide oxidoreductase YuxK